MQMPGRKYSTSGSYRYGFNGKENDNDVKGEGNQQDYGMRIYDGRLGRFLSIDPLYKEYPELTPYQFASNIPIKFIDRDGLERFNPQAKQPTGITFLSKAILPFEYNVDTKYSISVGHYRLHGVTSNDGKQWWVARKDVPGGYQDDWIVGIDAVGLFQTLSGKLDWIAEWVNTAEESGGGLLGAFKAAWSPANVAAGLTMGLAGVLASTPKSNVGTIVSERRQARHLSGNLQGYKNIMSSVEEAQSVVDAFHNGKAKVIGYKDNGKKGGGVTQVDVEFKGVTQDFFTKDLKTGEMTVTKTNKFRIEGTGKKVKVFPINPTK